MPARRPPTARRPRQLSLMLQPRWAAAHGLSPQACSETIARASLGPEAGEKCGWPQPVAHLVSHLRLVSACAQAPPPGRKGPPRLPRRISRDPRPAHLLASPSCVFEETERHLAEAEEKGTKSKSALARRPSFTANSSSPVLGPLKLPAKVLSSKSLIKATTDPTRGVSRFIVTSLWGGGGAGAGRGGGAFLNRTCMFQLIRSPPRPLPRCPRSPRGCHARS